VLTSSETEIKEWADKNGIRVPQGSKRNELLAIARKHRAQLAGDNVADSAKSAFGAATSSAGNQYAKATDDAQLKAEDAFNTAVGTWSEVRTCNPKFNVNNCSFISVSSESLPRFTRRPRPTVWKER